MLTTKIKTRYIFFLFYSGFLKIENTLFANSIKDQEIIIYKNFYFYQLQSNFYLLFFKKKQLSLSVFLYRIFMLNYFHNFDVKAIFRSVFRVLQTNSGFYFNFYKLNKTKNFYNFLKLNFMSFYTFLFKINKFLIFFFIFFLNCYFWCFLKLIPFNKIIFSWICFSMFLYWLLSGFVFFIKKYKFGKFTSVVQRFWRRTYILFWLIEGSTFLVFFYLTMNASQESFYMFDQISFFKTHLYSWRLFFLKLFLYFLLIILIYLLLISLKFNIFYKNLFLLVVITICLTYAVWVEFYQFFHILNFYGNFNWIYDIDEHIWVLEQESRKTRMSNHFVMLLFILKFWHIVFIYGFWVFSILRFFEIGRIRYVLLSSNLQNFIILYIFAWVFMYPWFKFFFRFVISTPYFWFYTNNRKLFFRVFFNDIKLFWFSIFNNFYFKRNKFFNFSFFYWKESLKSNSFEIFRKNIIKHNVLINI